MNPSFGSRVKRKLRSMAFGSPPAAIDLPEVRAALQRPAPPPLPPETEELRAWIQRLLAEPRAAARSLFTVGGQPAACWREEDIDPDDPWLLSPDYYPLYHALFRAATPGPGPRMLELGVRTGYMGVVFARATHGASRYTGVDPGLYLPNGLALARRALQQVSAERAGLTFELIAGSSHDPRLRRRLHALPRFDIIHIDGDHSLAGKIADLALCRDLRAPRGLVFVDDFHHMESVPLAIRRALELGWYRRFATAPTMRGLALLG